jgi:beta-glucosidase
MNSSVAGKVQKGLLGVVVLEVVLVVLVIAAIVVGAVWATRHSKSTEADHGAYLIPGKAPVGALAAPMGAPRPPPPPMSTVSRKPFLWGAATSAFQIEGNLTAGGRGPSIWDAFVTDTATVGNPDLACNSYFQFRDDIAVLRRMGATAYRLSIAWPRIIPGGTLLDPALGGRPNPALVNQQGLAYYAQVLTECRAAGLTPIVTLYHWDLPQALETAYGGWLCAHTYVNGALVPLDVSAPTDTPLAIVTDFVNYAKVCVAALGHLVTHWATINEPQTIAVDCYEFNWYAPGAGTADGNCPSGIDYRAAHNLLLAHAAAYHALHDAARAAGAAALHVGLVCNMDWGEPLDTSSPADVAAAQRANEFWGGWFWDPLFFGDYPATMRAHVTGGRLPSFTPAQSAALRGALDILYWNTYSTSFVTPSPASAGLQLVGWTYDQHTATTPIGADGKVIGTAGQSTWLHMVPWGAAKCLAWIQNRYSRPTPSEPGQGAPGVGLLKWTSATAHATSSPVSVPVPLMVTENGFDIVNEGIPTSAASAVADCVRTTYLQGYLTALAAAASRAGVDFVGYTPWALVDNYEWSHGFTARFGLTYIDFTDARGNLLTAGGPAVKLARVPKASAMALQSIVRAALQSA